MSGTFDQVVGTTIDALGDVGFDALTVLFHYGTRRWLIEDSPAAQ